VDDAHRRVLLFVLVRRQTDHASPVTLSFDASEMNRHHRIEAEVARLLGRRRRGTLPEVWRLRLQDCVRLPDAPI